LDSPEIVNGDIGSANADTAPLSPLRKITMFRNIRYYRLDNAWPNEEEELSETLGQSAFEPCGPLTERSSGFVPVYPDAGDSLARRLNGADLMKLRSQSRLLPPAVVNEELELRIEEFRNRMQEAPSPREKKRLKAETRDELMPKALLKSDKIWGFFDLKDKLVGIDAAQPASAERFLRRLRAAFGDLNLRPLQFQKPFSELLTSIFLGGAPEQFAVGRECRMRDPGDPSSVVRWTYFDLTDSTIRNHVANGMQLTHLGIVYDNIMSCVLDENGVITKLRFLGMDDDNEDHNDPLARLDAEFVVITGTLRLMIADLKKLLGGLA
jgi:recombination associated protein RdgC